MPAGPPVSPRVRPDVGRPPRTPGPGAPARRGDAPRRPPSLADQSASACPSSLRLAASSASWASARRRGAGDDERAARPPACSRPRGFAGRPSRSSALPSTYIAVGRKKLSARSSSVGACAAASAMRCRPCSPATASRSATAAPTGVPSGSSVVGIAAARQLDQLVDRSGLASADAAPGRRPPPSAGCSAISSSRVNGASHRSIVAYRPVPEVRGRVAQTSSTARSMSPASRTWSIARFGWSRAAKSALARRCSSASSSGLAAAELGAQQIREQVVVAELLPRGVERHDEEVRAGQLLEHRPRSRSFEHRVAPRAVEVLEHRGPGQELDQLVGQALDQLVAEVLGDQPVVPANRRAACSASGRSRTASAAR